MTRDKKWRKLTGLIHEHGFDIWDAPESTKKETPITFIEEAAYEELQEQINSLSDRVLTSERNAEKLKESLSAVIAAALCKR